MVGVVPPDGEPGLLMADPDDPYDHYYCRFGGSEALSAARRIITQHRGTRFFDWPESATLPPILERMHTLTRRSPPPSADDPVTPAEGLLAHVLATLEAPPHALEPATLTAERLIHYLQERIGEPIRLDEIADHFAVSKAHLCRQARVLLGETIVHTAEAMKMHWAQTLLGASDLPVKQVARRVGYTDAMYFSKVFRRRTGMSPGEWREASGNE